MAAPLLLTHEPGPWYRRIMTYRGKTADGRHEYDVWVLCVPPAAFVTIPLSIQPQCVVSGGFIDDHGVRI